MMFRKGSIKEFDPLRVPDDMRNTFEAYKESNPKPTFTSGLGEMRSWAFFEAILTEQFWLLSDVSDSLLNNAISKPFVFLIWISFYV